VFVPPIVDRELSDAAQAQRTSNKISSQPSCKREYLLRGRIKCLCGRSLSGHTCKDGQFRYYRCNGRYQYINDFLGCEIKSSNADIVETTVINWLRKLVENSVTLEADLCEAQRRQLEAIEPKCGRVENTDALIVTAEVE